MENQQEDIIEPENLKTIWYNDRFVEQLEEAVKTHPVPYEKMPQIIELQGIIPESADRILKETMEDTQKRERSVHGKIDLNGKLLVSNFVNVGKEESVATEIVFNRESPLTNPQYARREYLALTMHTHGDVDVPASGADLEELLRDFEQGSQVGLVLTKTSKMLFIRSLETPEFDPDATKLIIEQEHRKFEAAVYGALREKNERNNPAMQTAKNMQMILDLCQLYKIAVYTSYEGHRYSRINQ